MKYWDFAAKDKYGLSPESLSDYAHVIDECMDEAISSANPSEYTIRKHEADAIDLSSFRPQKSLNEKIWVNGRINSRVRLRLLDIADDFIEFLNVGWVRPDDIILTGSLANYNWSRYSDFDLHVVVDFKKVDERTEFVSEYFNAKKNEWNNNHENLKIYGFPVELYVQDSNETHTASGVYSLEKDKWLVEPERNNIKAIQLNKYYIKEKALQFIKAINKLQKEADGESDEHKISVIGRKVKKLFDKIKGVRKAGLLSSGEMSSGNIIYKILRRMGWIEVLLDMKHEVYDKMRSIEQ